MEFVLEAPYDGPVHQLKDMTVVKGQKCPTVKCGAELSPRSPDEDNRDWTAWDSLMTCEDCRGLLWQS